MGVGLLTSRPLLFCRVDTEEWIATIEALLSKSFDACQWLVEYFISSEGRELIK